MWDYLMALYEWLPGEFLVYHMDKDKWMLPYLASLNIKARAVTGEELLKAVKNPKNRFVHGGGASLGRLFKGKKCINMFYLGHGISEKTYYMSRNNKTLYSSKIGWSTSRCNQFAPLIFSRYIRKTLEFTVENLKRYFQINPDKPTLVYIATMGNYSFYPFGIVPILKELKDSYNVIVKPHPMIFYSKKIISKIREVSDVKIEFTNPLPFFEIADVIIGEVSGGTLPALFFAEKPLIYLRQSAFVCKSNVDCIITEKETDILTEKTLDTLPIVVKETTVDNQRIAAKKVFFRNWFGVFDGLEGRRMARCVVESVDNSEFYDRYNKLQSEEVGG